MSCARKRAGPAVERAVAPALDGEGPVQSVANAQEAPSTSLDASHGALPFTELATLDPEALALLVTMGC